MTGVVLVIVLVTKFLAGAWIAILAMAVLLRADAGIRRHYDRVAAELAADEDDDADAADPRCTRSCWSPSCTSRRCGRSPTPGRPGPTTLEAVTVNVDADETRDAAGRVGRAATSPCR